MNGMSMAQGISQRLQEKYGESLRADLIYSQLGHESGNFSSELASKHHNYAGLTQVEPNELPQPDGSNYYMSFASDDDFVDYMADYLYKYKENGLFNAKDARSYAAALKDGGYFGDDLDNYVAGMQRFIGQGGVADFAMIAQKDISPLEPVVEQEEEADATFYDKLYDSVYDSAVWGAFRTAATTRDLPDEENFRLTQEDIDAVQKELNGDYTATLWVCQNAHSMTQLQRLTRMKKEDLERRRRIDESDVGLSTLGTVMGALLDPINYIPVLGATGKVGNVARYARLAAANAVNNVVERGVTQSVTGYEQNYQMAALMGGVAGGLIPLSLDMMGKGMRRVANKVYGEAIDMQVNAEKMAKGERTSNAVLSDDDFLRYAQDAHDYEFAKTISDPDIAKHVSPDNKVFVLSLKDAKRLGEMRGQEVPDLAKGIFDDANGITVLIKDNLDGAEDLRKTILHEMGAHGLKYVLPEGEYRKVMSDLAFRVRDNPSPALKRALDRAYNKEDMEEVLGYFAEEAKTSHPLLRNIKKRLDKSLNALGVKGRMTEDDFIDLLTRSAKHNLENSKGYRVLEDGSCVFRGLRYSEKNILNPEKLVEAAKANGWLDKAVNWLKRKPLFATPVTMCQTSVSPMMRQIGERFLHNPYMNKVLESIPVEQQKAYILQRANRFHNDYHKIRDKYVVGKAPIRGRFDADMKRAFDREAEEAYNAVYGDNIAGHVGREFDPMAIEAAHKLKELRDYIIEVMKNNDKIFGEGKQILPDDWKNIDDELWRFIDDGQRAAFISRFEKSEDAIDFLAKYAVKAAKRDVIRLRMEDEAMSAWEKSASKAKKNLQHMPEKPLGITDEMVEAEVQKQARNWALGIVDQNASNRELSAANLTSDVGNIDFMRHRFPMDTSLVVKDPWGMDFSFDNELRSFDYDEHVPQLLNRFAGEVALHSVFSKGKVFNRNNLGVLEGFKDNIKNLRITVEQELQAAVNKRQITKSQMEDDLKTFDYIFDKLRGTTSKIEPRTKWDVLASSLRDMSYARNGIYIGANQLSEISGTMAYAGWAAIPDLLPSVGRAVTDIRLGQGASDMLDDALLDMFGEDARRYIWHNTNATSSKAFQRVGTGTSFDKAADKVAGAIKTSSSFISTLSGLPKLTDIMIQSARKQMLIDTVKWVNGAKMPWYRNPFSTKKLEAAGILYRENFRETLRPYLKMKDGKLVGLDVNALHKADPMTYMRLQTLLNNQSMRCITQETIGNSNMLKDSSTFWKIFFQFKDFTMRATHSQSFRIASNHEVDDILAAAYSMATVIPVYAGLAYLRAWGNYGDDKQKRDKYLEKYLSPGSLFYASFMRSSVFGSPFSTGNDLAEMTGFSLAPSIRTTVYRDSQQNIFENPESAVGSAITQLPAIKTGLDILSAGYDAGMSLRDDDRYTASEFKKAMSLLPGQNMFLLVRLRNELADELHLAKRD